MARAGSLLAGASTGKLDEDVPGQLDVVLGQVQSAQRAVLVEAFADQLADVHVADAAQRVGAGAT